jgi:hypothetical protein
MPRTRIGLPLLAALAMIPFAAAQQSAPAALSTRIPEITLEDVAFETAIDWLTEHTGLNIHVSWERLADYGIARDKPLSLKARNLPLSQVLWLLMNQAAGSDVKLAYRASGSLLVLSTEEDLGRELLTRVYDVRDLLSRAPNFSNAPRLNPAAALQQGGSGVSTGFDMGDQPDELNEPVLGDADPAGAELVRLISETVEPDSWSSVGGAGRIMFWRGRIVVYNTLLVHQRLAGPVQDEP